VTRQFAGAFFAALLVASCGTSTPSPSTFDATPGPASLTPFPPQPVRDAIVQQFGIGIGIDPLSPRERDQIAASRRDAIQTALASRGVGMPGPNGKGEIAWTSTGFVYLASYTPPVGPGAYGGGHPDRSPIPAYLVQVIAPPIAGYPGFNTALVIVDARSGALVSTMGSCNGPLCDPH
jgi:hypothetical protein